MNRLQRPETDGPGPERLDTLATTERVAVLPVTLLEPGQALLLPFAQITRVQSPPHAHGDIMVKTAASAAWYAFTRESWALVFDPHSKTVPCRSCRRTWIEGCVATCGARIVSDGDAAAALATASLTGRWSAAEIQAARP